MCMTFLKKKKRERERERREREGRNEKGEVFQLVGVRRTWRGERGRSEGWGIRWKFFEGGET